MPLDGLAYGSSARLAALTVLLAACSSAGAPVGIWRGSVDNGCKPGVGVELVRTAAGVAGSVFVLDPDKPGDFSAGARHRMDIGAASETEIRFAVAWTPSRRDEMTLRLADPLADGPVRAVLQSADGRDAPTEVVLRRLR